MKVSVIIPVYNVRPYLERCLRSVLCQTYKDLEIIMVDDGSTDGSGELAEQLATLDSRICVIHQENQGLSGARNTGLRAAQGNYVVFLDSDDEWLLKDGIERLMQDTESDIIIFKVVEIWPSGRKEYMSDYNIETLLSLPNAQSLFEYFVYNRLFRASAVLLLVRREFLIQHSIFFPLGLISEDVYWSLHLWQHIRTVGFCNIDLYGYHHRSGSITQTVSFRVYESYDKIFNHFKEQCASNCINARPIAVYLSRLWVTLAYSFNELPSNRKREAMVIMKSHSDVLTYAQDPKTRRALALVKLVGVKNTTLIFGWYWWARNIVKHHVI